MRKHPALINFYSRNLDISGIAPSVSGLLQPSSRTQRSGVKGLYQCTAVRHYQRILRYVAGILSVSYVIQNAAQRSEGSLNSRPICIH